MSWEVIQVRLYDVANIMKSIRHRTLESGTGIFKIERYLLISEGAPRTNESCLMLVCGGYVDLVVTRESIHKRINLTSYAVIDKLINKRSRKVIFWTGTINIAVVNTDPDSALLFIHRDYIRHPIRKGNGVNETVFKKLFDFGLDGCSLSGVHRA